MKKIFLVTYIVLLATSLSFAQISVGVKGGFTATMGYFSTPQQTVASTTSMIPAITNKNGGIGFGGVAGVYAKYNLNDKLFVMLEAEYNHFLLKQESNSRADVNAIVSVRNAVPFSFPDNSVFTNLNNRAEVVYQAISVPILIGTTFANKYRVFAGPRLLFPVSSKITNFTSGNVEANPATNFTGAFVPTSTTSADLLTKEGGVLELKRFTWGADLGVGYTFPETNIDLDLRYSVNLGGLTKNTEVKGFFGAFLVTIGYRFGNSGEAASTPTTSN